MEIHRPEIMAGLALDLRDGVTPDSDDGIGDNFAIMENIEFSQRLAGFERAEDDAPIDVEQTGTGRGIISTRGQNQDSKKCQTYCHKAL